MSAVSPLATTETGVAPARPGFRLPLRFTSAGLLWFVMAVAVEGHPETRGEGRTKRIATQEAATALLSRLESIL